MYAGGFAATPQKSAVAVSTIGGEPGGRAPIVVQDKPVVPAVEEEDQTSVIIGKAEPGRDIFASDSAKAIQSENMLKVDTLAVVAEKEISTVIVGSSSSQSSPESSPESETETVAVDGTDSGEPRPLDEAEAEAERAAQELFPEAVAD